MSVCKNNAAATITSGARARAHSSCQLESRLLQSAFRLELTSSLSSAAISRRMVLISCSGAWMRPAVCCMNSINAAAYLSNCSRQPGTMSLAFEFNRTNCRKFSAVMFRSSTYTLNKHSHFDYNRGSMLISDKNTKKLKMPRAYRTDNRSICLHPCY